MARTALEVSKWLGYLSEAEVDLVRECAAQVPADGVIVGIGAGAGTHTLAILETTEDCVVFSIDIRCGERPELTSEHLRIAEAGYGETGHVIRIWGDSKVVGKRWPIPVDFCFIDGDHTEEGIIGDIQAWARHVKPGGIIAFHDYGSPNWPAVAANVDKMEKRGGWEFFDQKDTLIAFTRKEE